MWSRNYWTSHVGRAGLLAHLVERLSTRLPHQIISVLQQTSERLRTELGATTPITTVPFGVDIEGIDRAVPSSVRADVLYGGRLVANKNVDTLLRAVAIAADYQPQLHCLIVGEGPERLALEQLARDLGVSHSERFVGFPPDDELYGVMKSCGVFVLPSAGQGFGLVVLEENICVGFRSSPFDIPTTQPAT